jgi:hypothetical protein
MATNPKNHDLKYKGSAFNKKALRPESKQAA